MITTNLRRWAVTGLLALATAAGTGALATGAVAQAHGAQARAAKRSKHRSHHKSHHSKPKPKHSSSSPGGIPQNGGGDNDADNHGAPSDGDGNM